ncbi:bifunctional 4-hydroxy-2-oxoglutarate aldolase/2-dehydro-3-deoxy-phosphogluconate aldolase [Flavobacterium sp. TSSA_36]|uniref:bifunctional 4-hydroxy-2-oxoglutarate aldolase/2-dehydro-3-deoxy-phosphogluconate aldolase n=1 Tax=Flavobacterium sp. TSSA_36 TaxID=3447669 RepID=UPI003F3D27E1
MNTKDNIINTILGQGMLPLYYHEEAEISIAVLQALYRSGIRVVEYTSRGDRARHNFKELLQVRNDSMPDLFIGIGTMKNLQQVRDYLALGADFFISPGFLPEVASFLFGKSVLYVPGCMTPTEIISAENAGMTLIKLFPGNCIGTDFLIAIKDLFPGIAFMPTGGVTTNKENIEAWFTAGVSAVGMGSQLISKDLMNRKEFTALEQATRKVVETIHTIKTSK